MNSWPAPVPLLEYKDEKFQINGITVNLIVQIDNPMIIVSTYGSSLLNQPFQANQDCALTSDDEQTSNHGLWAWYVNHPTKLETGILILISRGCDETTEEKVRDQLLNFILILSSVFVCNIEYTDGINIGENVDFIRVADRIHDEMSQTASSVCPHFFPSLVLSVSGFDLKSEKPDDNCMKEKIFSMQMESNDDIRMLRMYFPRRKYFFLDQKMIEEDDDDNSQLQEIVTEYQNHIISNGPVKKFNSRHMDGEIFVQLLKRCVSDMDLDLSVPNVGSHTNDIIKHHNTFTMEQSLSLYIQSMKECLVYPADMKKLGYAHYQCSVDALKHFLDKMFLTEAIENHKIFQECLAKEYVSFVENNLKTSSAVCTKIISNLFQEIRKKLENRFYFRHNGLKDFRKDMEQLRCDYLNNHEKLVLSDAELQKFSIAHEQDAALILRQDGQLSEYETTVENRKIILNKSMYETELKRGNDELIEQQIKTLKFASRKQIQLIKSTYRHKLEEETKEVDQLIAIRKEEKDHLLSNTEYFDEAELIDQQIDHLLTTKEAIWDKAAAFDFHIAGLLSNIYMPFPIGIVAEIFSTAIHPYFDVK